MSGGHEHFFLESQVRTTFFGPAAETENSGFKGPQPLRACIASQDASGYQHAEQPPSASVPSEPKKPKFAALPKMPVQAKAPAQPAQGELPDPSSTPAQTSASVDETYAAPAPLPDMSADSSQAHERHEVPAALKSALSAGSHTHGTSNSLRTFSGDRRLSGSCPTSTGSIESSASKGSTSEGARA